MTKNSFFTGTNQDYQAALLLLNKIFQVKKRLPEQVFKSPFLGFVCGDFDNCMSVDFWDLLLQPLGKKLNDSHILTAVLDPDPKNYFYHNFGYYNMLNLPINMTGAEYLNNLVIGPAENEADAILYNSEVVVWVPNGGRWAIWGERSYEVCILAFADEQAMTLALPLLNKNWKSADNGLNSFVLKHVSKSFLTSFMSNYLIGGKGWKLN
jgi:hypothetical protein